MINGMGPVGSSKTNGYTNTTLGVAPLHTRIGVAQGSWQATFDAPYPTFPTGTRVYLQPTGGTATINGSIVLPDVAVVANAPLIGFEITDPTNFSINLSAGTLRILVLS